MALLQTIRDRFFDIRSGEAPKAFGLSFYFFLVIAVFWVLKPLKRGLLIGYFGEDPITLVGWTLTGAEAEQMGKVLNMFVAYAIVVAFTWLSTRLSRQQLVAAFSAVFGGLFVLFAVTIEGLGQAGVWSFYVLGDIWTTVMVATFWAITNDLNTADEAERLYGVIGLGGVVGGFVGASVVSGLVTDIGRAPLLLGLLLPLAAIVGLVYWINRCEVQRGTCPEDERPCCPEEDASASAEEAETSGANAALEGAKLVFQSKYLLGIAGVLALYEVTSNVVDFQLATVVETRITSDLARDQFFGFIGQATGIVSILVQLIVTPYVLKRFGVRVALFVLPAVVLIGSMGFLAVPVLALAGFMSVGDNALNYSINQSAKEALYTPTSQDAKYKAKAFIDMFVQRAAKVFSVGLNLSLPALVFGSVRWLSIPVIGIIAAWLGVIRFLGQQFETRAAAQRTAEGDGAAPDAAPALAEAEEPTDAGEADAGAAERGTAS
ncbi:MAG: hypothetical protein GVY35_07820 [Bacteroidetes bacterium]|jgi:AAA family ATP:ADP antiporter|nr:hypothetical protein [Bacteroidota bacterium]